MPYIYPARYYPGFALSVSLSGLALDFSRSSNSMYLTFFAGV